MPKPKAKKTKHSVTKAGMTNKRTGKRIRDTKTLFNKICSYVESGMTLSAIGQMDDMPSDGVIRKWRRAKPEYERMYQTAKMAQLECYEDEMLSLVKDSKASKMPTKEEIAKELGKKPEDIDTVTLRAYLNLWQRRRDKHIDVLKLIVSKGYGQMAHHTNIQINAEADKQNQPLINVVSFTSEDIGHGR